MNILLVYPEFPTTYWGFQYGLSLVGRRASVPPLGLLTLAALLPPDWTLRLVDLNVETLPDRLLRWADAVLISGMRIQLPGMHAVIRRARALGRRTVVGGPAPTTAPSEFADADLIVQGEMEGRVDALVRELQTPSGTVRLLPGGDAPRPELTDSPAPRYDLLRLERYASMSLQYSRGCPFRCEFCDIIEIYGRRPRVKSIAQVLGELEALHRRGYRGSLFFVDDNFIGNKASVRRLLPELARWQREYGYPFELFTEASVNLAADPALVRAMVDAGFTAVFLGIETPVPAALREADKGQNLKLDLARAVEHLSDAGLEVMGGFIVGFDSDPEEIFELQRAFIDTSPIPLAMVGPLMALPGTALWRRLAREGRLRSNASGDQFGRPNFVPAMDERKLLAGYGDLLARIYSADAYYRRCHAHLRRARPLPGRRRTGWHELRTAARVVWRIGLRGRRRRQFWRLMSSALRRAPHALTWAFASVVRGEHLIRYTEEDVLPRLRQALGQLARERAACAMVDAAPPLECREADGIDAASP